MKNFEETYASLYDNFHATKNYSTEVQNLIIHLDLTNDKFKNILDFGCGTGMHVNAFSEKGFTVFGYDISKSMIELAKKKCGTPERFLYSVEGLDSKFDLVYSLFDVMNYQVSTNELDNFLDSIISATKHHGVIVLDGWHKPGVRKDPPRKVSKKFISGESCVERTVLPLQSQIKDIYPLEIKLINCNDRRLFSSEIHILRAYSENEIREQLLKRGCSDIVFQDGQDLSKNLSSDSWKFFVKATVNK